MLTLKVRPAHESNDWDWAVNRGRVTTLDGIQVAILGAADYTVDPDNPNQLLSINGTYMEGIRQNNAVMRQRGVRWGVSKDSRGQWRTQGDDLSRIALELLLGVVVDSDGWPLDLSYAEALGKLDDEGLRHEAATMELHRGQYQLAQVCTMLNVLKDRPVASEELSKKLRASMF
jgi:hypothetical protein